jgi:riboflavin biosynthesis pyrimidine reductase
MEYSMNGQEIERLLSLIETSTTLSRDELIAYVEKNKDRILRDLQEKGVAEIPVEGGKNILLRYAA